jgi:hypothetical protein
MDSCSAEDVSWLLGCSTSRGDYSIAGIEIEHSATQIPLHTNLQFSLDKPTLLLKARAAKKVGPIQYEPITGPSPGLLIWIQKKKL